MEALALLRRAREAGLRVEVDAGELVIRGPRRLEPLALELLQRHDEVLELLAPPALTSGGGPAERGVEGDPPGTETPPFARATAQLRARLDRADRIEAAAPARGEAVPDPDDPGVDYWAWCDAQPDPAPADAGPWPRETVEIRVELDGRITGGPPPAIADEARPMPGLRAVQRRLCSLLVGRLWKDKSGWWPRDAGLPPARAESVAAHALEASPLEGLPPASLMTAARGPDAVFAWRQVVSCLVAELDWSVDRAASVAALVVDPCFNLAEGAS